MRRRTKRFWCEIASCAYVLSWMQTPFALHAEIEETLGAVFKEDLSEELHTINFNNISIIEFIRFVSKITNLNFVFEEGDLQFTVTVISEEPVSARNVSAALAQVLRVHGLMLLEQDNNILIVKSEDVNQIPTIISNELPDSKMGNAAIVTQVFRIKNANLNSIANIIRPMTSKTALIEVSNETRQLIVTDIATNVEKIAALLLSLDAPHTPLEIETYVVRHIGPTDLIQLTQQILSPFAEGNPLIFVPQVETNSVFIVSTPYLIERAIAVMEDLDLPSKPIVVGQKTSPGKNVFVYQPTNHTPKELKEALSQIDGELKSIPGDTTSLGIAIESAEIIEDTQSLLFIAESETIDTLKALLAALDNKAAFPGIRSQFLIYTPQFHSGQELFHLMEELLTNLKDSHLTNGDLIAAIDSMKWISSHNLLIFTGDIPSLDKVTAILKTIDIVDTYNAKASQVFVYKPQYTSHRELQAALTRLLDTLDTKAMPDHRLASAIESMEWNSDTQSFILTADGPTIDRLKSIFSSLDNADEENGKAGQGFFLYKLKNAEGNTVVAELKNVASQLPPNTVQNQNIIDAIDQIRWIESTNSLLITGANRAIQRIQTLIDEFDVPLGSLSRVASKSSFFIYKPLKRSIDQMMKAIPEMNRNLQESGLVDPQLFASLGSMTYAPDAESLIFTGSSDTLQRVQEMVQQIDSGACASHIQCLGPTTFMIYPLQHVSGDQLIASLKSFASQLDNSAVEDKSMASALEDMRYIRETNSILFIAPKETLDKINQLIPKFDIAALAKAPPPNRPSATYITYAPKYQTGPDLISVLGEFEANLKHSGVSDEGLFDVIGNLRWIEKTGTLLISGHADAVAKVQDLLQQFDVPTKDSNLPAIADIDNTSFLVYKLQYHQGSDIRDALKQVATNLPTGPTSNNASLMNAINSIQWIQVTNSLLASGDQSVLVKLKNLIQNLDVPLRQVFIEVLVIETQLNNTQNFGLMWGSQVQYMNKTILSTGNFPIATGTNATGNTPVSTFAPLLQGMNTTTTPTGGASGIPFTSGFDLGVIGDIIMHKGRSFISLGSLVNALQLDTNTTVVMNPKIIAQDNQQSIIFVGTNVPYTGAVVSTVGNSTQQTTSNIEYRDVGVSLTITPILGDNDIVTLDIVHDISEVIQGASSTNSTQLTGITTTHTHMETRVHVPDQHFVALSGMLQDNKQRYRTAIPCLGGLPVIGALFSENDRIDQKSNVIIFMRPFIINSYEEYKQITEHQEWLYKDQATLPILKEDFDAGLDLVKTPADE